MAEPQRVRGSYRDPSGHVYRYGDSILRTVTQESKAAYEWARDQDIHRASYDAGFLIGTKELAEKVPALAHAPYVLEHPLIPYISWPYEWSFSQLRDAALLHLDFQLFLLDRNAVLSDASAFNVQFVGRKAVFIDALSIRPYREREYWSGYQQFCNQFLNPLLLRARKGIAHNAWYRGSMDGVSTRDMNALLSFRDKLSFNILTHVVLPANLEASALEDPAKAVGKIQRAGGLSKFAYRGILQQLRRWISGMKPRGLHKTVWGEYAGNNTYLPEDVTRKSDAVRTFCRKHEPPILFDLGCNTGFYSGVALDSGAKYVVGFDFDHAALERAHAESEHVATFLPLWLDASNPSPSQGWRQQEREGFFERSRADAVVALAFEHHLAIGRNVPLEEVVDWLVGLAPRGLVEFVPKKDQTVQTLLALREDIFPDYNRENFIAALSSRTKVVACSEITASGRALIEYG